jgi:phenylacetate-CoA ligase
MGYPHAAVTACLARARLSRFYATRIPSRTVWTERAFGALPLTRKDDLRRHGASAFLAAPDDVLQYHESFGTTGTTAGSWFSRADYACDLVRVRDWSVAFAHRRVLVRFPYALSMPAHLAQRAIESVGGSVIAASSRTTVCSHARAVRLMTALDVRVVACSPFEALLLAETARALHTSHHLDAVCVAGELLSAGYRRLVGDAWSAPVHNLYGATETGALATSCRHGQLHVCDGQLIEVIRDRVSLERAAPGEPGHVVVTTLDRGAMPLVRYDTGDVGRALPADSCRCGRNAAVLEVVGRADTTRARRRSEREVLDLASAVAHSAGANLFAAAVEGDEVVVRVEPAVPTWDPRAATGNGIRVETLPPGTLVDRALLLAECAARKPRLVSQGGVSSMTPLVTGTMVAG